jgi:hypothetical protein
MIDLPTWKRLPHENVAKRSKAAPLPCESVFMGGLPIDVEWSAV